VLSTLTGDTDWVDAVAVNADGSLIASGSASGAVLVWNGSNGKLLATLK
jgi:WD40 repeat protein